MHCVGPTTRAAASRRTTRAGEGSSHAVGDSDTSGSESASTSDEESTTEDEDEDSDEEYEVGHEDDPETMPVPPRRQLRRRA